MPRGARICRMRPVLERTHRERLHPQELPLLALPPVAAGIWLIAPATPLAWSGVLYGASFLLLGVATDYRCHLWTILSIGLALGLHFSRQEDWRGPLKRLAAAPVGTVVAAAISRLALP